MWLSGTALEPTAIANSLRDQIDGWRHILASHRATEYVAGVWLSYFRNTWQEKERKNKGKIHNNNHSFTPLG